jgi:CheY-like chemotaxis protein
MMPDVDGFQLAEQIKRHPDFAGTPVILLSSADRQPDSPRCRQAGVAAYLSKPVKQSELLDAIRMAVDPSASAAKAQTIGCDRPPQASAICLSQRPSVLLVEDNVTNQLLAVALLEKEGYTVETAQNGKEALAVLTTRAFGVVLMDVQMPEMDGFETTARIRERERSTGEHIPIVAMTAHALKGDRQRCLDAGMDGYLTKPIHASDLYEALALFSPPSTFTERMPRTLQPAEGVDTRSATSAETKSVPAGPPAGMLDKPALLARVGGREDRLRTIIQVFLDESSMLMAELNDAIIRGDASRLRRPAHSLKGAVGIFGAPGVVAAAVTLESLGQAGELSGATEAYSHLDRELGKLKSHLAAILSRPTGHAPA